MTTQDTMPTQAPVPGARQVFALAWPMTLKAIILHGTVVIDCLPRGAQGLPQHLSTEDQAPTEVLALSAKEIVLESFERQQRH